VIKSFFQPLFSILLSSNAYAVSACLECTESTFSGYHSYMPDTPQIQYSSYIFPTCKTASGPNDYVVTFPAASIFTRSKTKPGTAPTDTGFLTKTASGVLTWLQNILPA
jgi:hypothetical protein